MFPASFNHFSKPFSYLYKLVYNNFFIYSYFNFYFTLNNALHTDFEKLNTVKLVDLFQNLANHKMKGKISEY